MTKNTQLIIATLLTSFLTHAPYVHSMLTTPVKTPLPDQDSAFDPTTPLNIVKSQAVPALSSQTYVQPHINPHFEFSPHNVNIPNQWGQTRLHSAAFNNDTGTTHTLLAHGALIDKPAQSGQTALHVAAQYGHKAIIEILLNSKASVNLADQTGQTPLHKAALYGKTEAITLLLAAQANVNSADNNSQTPLNKAFEYHKKSNNNEAAKLLILAGGYSRHPQNYSGSFLYRKMEQQDKSKRKAIRKEARTDLKKAISTSYATAFLPQQSNTSLAETVRKNKQRNNAKKTFLPPTIQQQPQNAQRVQKLITHTLRALSNANNDNNVHLGIECPYCEYINKPKQHACECCNSIFP